MCISLWNGTAVGRRCGTVLWNGTVGRYCGTVLWNGTVERDCGTVGRRQMWYGCPGPVSSSLKVWGVDRAPEDVSVPLNGLGV